MEVLEERGDESNRVNDRREMIDRWMGSGMEVTEHRGDESDGVNDRMEVLERSRDLVNDFRGFALCEGVFCSLLNPGEEFPTFHALHHNQQDSRAIVDVFVNINNPDV